MRKMVSGAAAPLGALALPLVLLTACQSAEERAQDRVEDRIEESTGVDASRQTPSPGALALTEAQLLDAQLVDPSGEVLGDIEAVQRDDAGVLTALVVAIDDAGTPRRVEIPLKGLSTAGEGAELDVLASMTIDQLASYPDVPAR